MKKAFSAGPIRLRLEHQSYNDSPLRVFVYVPHGYMGGLRKSPEAVRKLASQLRDAAVKLDEWAAFVGKKTK